MSVLALSIFVSFHMSVVEGKPLYALHAYVKHPIEEIITARHSAFNNRFIGFETSVKNEIDSHEYGRFARRNLIHFLLFQQDAILISPLATWSNKRIGYALVTCLGVSLVGRRAYNMRHIGPEIYGRGITNVFNVESHLNADALNFVKHFAVHVDPVEMHERSCRHSECGARLDKGFSGIVDGESRSDHSQKADNKRNQGQLGRYVGERYAGLSRIRRPGLLREIVGLQAILLGGFGAAYAFAIAALPSQTRKGLWLTIGSAGVIAGYWGIAVIIRGQLWPFG